MAPLEPHAFFIAGLEKSGLPYCITGSVASGIYGESRHTRDIDLIVVIRHADIGQLQTIFPEDGFYLPPVETLILEVGRDHRGMFNVIHHASQFKADVFIVSRDPLHRWALQHRRRITLPDDLHTWVAPPEYVILRKLEYFRESDHDKHLRDIRYMLATTLELDRDFIDSQIVRLGLQAQWRIVLEPGEPLFPPN
jgi:hypothetical protein